MGYYIEVTDSKIVIKKENFDKALEALKAVFVPENMTCRDYIHGVEYPHFSWFDTRTVLEADTLEKALREIRYEPVYDDGNICNVEFTGEKLGDDEVFFNALAPYIEVGSYIHYMGEDGDRWGYEFKDE